MRDFTSINCAAITRKSPATVEIQLLHQIQITQVFIGDSRDRNVVNVDLFLTDQIQQQVERSFKFTERNFQLIVFAVGSDGWRGAGDTDGRRRFRRGVGVAERWDVMLK